MVFDAGFFPFMCVVENLRALVLKLSRGVRKFITELLVEARKRESGVLGLVGHGEAVINRLIILHGVDEFVRGFVGARTREEQWRFRNGQGIGIEDFESVLGTADFEGVGSIHFEDLLFYDEAWIILQKRGEFLGGLTIFVKCMVGLCDPEEGVLMQQRVGLGLLEPREGLREARFGIVVVTKSEGGALSPNAGDIFIGEGGELIVRAGNAMVKIASEKSYIVLRGDIFRSGRVESGRGGLRFATRLAGRRFQMRGLFLFMGGSLCAGGEGGEEKQRSAKH